MNELLWAYEEYCEDCRMEGRVPKKYWEWLDGQE